MHEEEILRGFLVWANEIPQERVGTLLTELEQTTIFFPI